jgi:cell division transport system permease protein
MNLFVHNILRRTLQNIRGNLFPNLTTVGIIAISMLIFSAFTLVAFNLTSFLRIWEDKIEVIAYLKKQTSLKEVEGLLKDTRRIEGIEAVKYISPFDAMAFMESKLGRQKNLLEGIQSGILPASFEIQLKKEYRNSVEIKKVVYQLKRFPQFEEIQYGQEWVETFSSLVHVLRLTQWVLGGLILIAMVFIISNTIQLTISSRRDEIEIMHIVGATPAFIQIPFYIEGLLQGLIGAGLAVLILFLLHQILFLNLPTSIQSWLARFPLLFLPVETIVRILAGGMILGFFGSFIASIRFLKYGE